MTRRPRHGFPKPAVAREVHTRTIEATCRTCGWEFANTGAAWTHVASSHHVVDVSYATEFTFTPEDIS